jgi:DNA primase
MIPDDVVERVRAAADIVEIVREHVALKRMGGDWRGPCPFHGGQKPNFSVSAKRGSYHCFVCGESGDVFTFLRKRLGLDFTTAVRQVGERVGIEVVDRPTRGAPGPDPRTPLWEALAAADEFFARQFRASAEAAAAREYWAGRGLRDEDAARFGAGYAPRDGRALLDHLATLGIDGARAVEAGLATRREGDPTLRPRFRGRLVLPIHDIGGTVVGFGGRALGDEPPKYLNSAESTVFQKRELLYQHHVARQAIRREERVVVVEGYFDVIRLALTGVESAVAPLGTALTDEQAQRLARYKVPVVLCYDGDAAGRKATYRSGMALLRLGCEVLVTTLPDGEDPDSFAQREGAAGVARLLAHPLEFFEWQLLALRRRGWFADIGKRRRAIDKLLPAIRVVPSPVTRDLYLAALAEAAGVERAHLAGEAEARPAEPGSGRRAAAEGEPPPAAPDEAAPDGRPRLPPSAGSIRKPEFQWAGRRAKWRRDGDAPVWFQEFAHPTMPSLDRRIALTERELAILCHADQRLAERLMEIEELDLIGEGPRREVIVWCANRGSVEVEAQAPLSSAAEELLREVAHMPPPDDGARLFDEMLQRLSTLVTEGRSATVDALAEAAPAEDARAVAALRDGLDPSRRPWSRRALPTPLIDGR